MPISMKLKFDIKYILLFLLFLLEISSGCMEVSASFPIVRNFTKQEYAADTQNWDIDQDYLGRIFIANKRGLMIFDGSQWDLVGLPYSAAARSVRIDEDSERIYMGGYNIFGYYKPDSITGALKFVTLSDKLPDKQSTGDVWNIFTQDKFRWFQGDHSLYRYDGKEILTIQTDSKIVSSAIVAGRIFYATELGELFEIKNLRAYPVTGTEILKGKNIKTIIADPLNSNIALIVTAFDGVFRLDGNNLEHMQLKIDDFLINSQVFCASANGDNIIFGTVNSGAAVYNIHTGQTSFIERETGLQNNTVLSTFFDSQGNIWLGLDNGIDYILHNSPIRRLLPQSFAFGTGYTSLPIDDKLLLGTNQGLYAIKYPSETIPSPTMLLHGQVWSITQCDNNLFVCTDIGVYFGNSQSLNKIDGINGAWDVKLLPGSTDKAIVSGYTDYYLISRNGNTWVNAGKIPGFKETVGRFIFDNVGNMWIVDWQKGVYRMRYDENSNKFVNVRHLRQKDGVSMDANNSVAIIDGNILLSNPAGMSFMTPNGLSFKTAETANKIFNDRNPSHFYQSPSGDVVMVNYRKIAVAGKKPNGDVFVDSTTYNSIHREIVPGFDHISFCDGGMILACESGFFELNKVSGPDTTNRPRLFINMVYLNQDSVVWQAGRNTYPLCEIPYKSPSVTFVAALPEYRLANAVTYSFYLEGYDKSWSPYSKSNSKEYTGLSYGNYILKVRAHDSYDNSTYEVEYKFVVATPWYFSLPMKLVYVCLILLILGIATHFIARVADAKARKAEEEKEREIKRLREEALQEKMRSETEIEILHKSQIQSQSEIENLQIRQKEQEKTHGSESLSVITKSALQRNEMLMSFSHLLQELQDSIEADSPKNVTISSKVGELLVKVNMEMNRSDDFSDISKNFDKVYGDYLNRLTTQFPDLSKSDIKLACYIKMGLSTKEIAPLFNVASKSIEMSRYRLRKKLNLTRADNLTEFLQNY